LPDASRHKAFNQLLLRRIDMPLPARQRKQPMHRKQNADDQPASIKNDVPGNQTPPTAVFEKKRE